MSKWKDKIYMQAKWIVSKHCKLSKGSAVSYKPLWSRISNEGFHSSAMEIPIVCVESFIDTFKDVDAGGEFH